MPPSPKAEDLLTMIEDLQRQVREISTTAQTEHSSIREGSLRILDADGNDVIQIGKIGGSYGIRILSVEDRQVFAAGRGISTAPPGYIQMVPLGNLSGTGAHRPGTTSGSYAELWRGQFFATATDIFWPVVVWPNANTMDFKVTIAETPSGVETDVYTETGITLPGNRSNTFDIPTACLAPSSGTDVLGRFYFLRYYARRTAGTTTVDVSQQYAPFNAQV